FGTFEFRLAAAADRSPLLAYRIGTIEPLRDSDLDVFYGRFAVPPLARALFQLVEAHRIDCRMLAAYPGIRGDHEREAATELDRRQPVFFIADLRGVLEAALRFTLGVPAQTLTDIDATGI